LRGRQAPARSAASGAAVPAPGGAGRGAAAPWATVAGLVGMAMWLCNVDRNILSVLAVPLMEELGLGLPAMGIVQSSFLWGYLAGQFPAGYLSDRCGGARVMLFGLLSWSLVVAATPLANLLPRPVLGLVAARVALGVLSACALPATAAAVAEWVPADRRGGTTSAVYACFNMGTVTATLLTPLISAAYGWPAAFTLFGGLGVAGALAGLRLLPAGGPEESQGGEPGRAAPSGEGKAGNGGGGGGGGEDAPQRTLLSPPPRWGQLGVLMFAHMVIGLGFFTVQSWIPTYVVRDLGFADLRVAGLVGSVPWLAMAVWSVLCGWLSDRMLRSGLPTPRVRQIMMTLSTALPTAGFVGLTLVRGAAPCIACLMLAMCGLASSYAGYHAYLIDVCGDLSGTVVGFTNTFGILAGIAASILTGVAVARTGNFNVVFRAMALFYFASGVFWNLWMKGEPLYPDEPAAG